jgi:RimJ/RimL family protein N-acetyltransferase
MGNRFWPLFDLAVHTPRVTLRYPDDEMLERLAAVAAEGVHPPERMPFLHPWTRAASPQLERDALRHWWGLRAAWVPEHWRLACAVLVDDEAVGVQFVRGEHFAVTRTVETGSWLGLRHQGQGIGTEMRTAVLHLAFAGLGAEAAESGAFEDNVASLALSRRLGYVPNGMRTHDREGAAARVLELRLDRATWERQRRDDITIEGLDACREWFGLSPADSAT